MSTMDVLMGLRKSLEKVVDDHSEQERIADELDAIAALKVTPNMIKDSKLGKILLKIREKFDKSSSISNKAKDILINWKRIVEGNQKEFSVKADTKVTIHRKPDFPVEYRNSLTSLRKSMVSIFQGIFKESPASEQISFHIEKALHDNFSSDSQQKTYNAKAKQLSFNLKKNEVSNSAQFIQP